MDRSDRIVSWRCSSSSRYGGTDVDKALYVMRKTVYRMRCCIGSQCKLDSQNYKQRVIGYSRTRAVRNLLLKVIERKLRLFRRICRTITRMTDARKLKTLIFSKMDNSNKRGRPRGGVDRRRSGVEWCGSDNQALSYSVDGASQRMASNRQEDVRRQRTLDP